MEYVDRGEWVRSGRSYFRPKARVHAVHAIGGGKVSANASCSTTPCPDLQNGYMPGNGDDEITQKWAEVGEILERLAHRVGDADDFPVGPKSSLAEDDSLSQPFTVSQAVRHLISVSVDQRHGRSRNFEIDCARATSTRVLVRLRNCPAQNSRL